MNWLRYKGLYPKSPLRGRGFYAEYHRVYLSDFECYIHLVILFIQISSDFNFIKQYPKQ